MILGQYCSQTPEEETGAGLSLHNAFLLRSVPRMQYSLFTVLLQLVLHAATDDPLVVLSWLSGNMGIEWVSYIDAEIITVQVAR